MTESAFFQDLAILMTVAGVVSVAFGKLKWPKVIGYILGGIILGGYTWGGSFLADPASTRTIGQLGVVFLMFSMGLGFSMRELKEQRLTVIPVALVDTVVMIWLGYTVGTRIFGWGAVPSIFLGAAICDSATTMLAKVIDEMGWGSKRFVKYAMGSSVCEDIICVGVIALVTGVAAGEGLELADAMKSLGGLLVFFLSVIIFGMVLIPRLLLSVNRVKDEEALILTALGCLFFISYVAYRCEFSLALGAFLVGIIAAASDVRHRLDKLTAPLRSMFAAVFFVSIGLLVDPRACLSNFPAILLLTMLVIGGKFVNCASAALIAGERFKTAIQMGMSLAQIGEFAFMVAILYMGIQGDRENGMYQIVVAVSLLTTLLNPLLIRWSGPVADWAEQKLPERVKGALDAYRAMVIKFHEGSEAADERRNVRRSALMLAMLAMLTFAVSTACGMLYRFDYSRFSPGLEKYDWVMCFFAANLFALAMLPMVLKFSRQLGAAIARVLAAGAAKWLETARNAIALVVVVAVMVLYFAELIMINISFAPKDPIAGLTMTGVLALATIFGWRYFIKVGARAARRFNEALGAEARQQRLLQMTALKLPEGAVYRIKLSPESSAVGETVMSLDIRAKTGALVVAVFRHGEFFRNVDARLSFEAGDELVVSGEVSQIMELCSLVGCTQIKGDELSPYDDFSTDG